MVNQQRQRILHIAAMLIDGVEHGNTTLCIGLAMPYIAVANRHTIQFETLALVDGQWQALKAGAAVGVGGPILLDAAGGIGLSMPYIAVASFDGIYRNGIAVMNGQIQDEGTVTTAWRSTDLHRVEGA